jgi:hypothetical protein
MGELDPGNDEGTSTSTNMAGGSRAAGHGEEEEEVTGHGEEEEELAGHEEEGHWPPAMGKRALALLARCRGEKGARWPRGRGVLAAGNGEEGARAIARLLAMGKRVPTRCRGEEGARRARGKRVLAHREEAVGSDSTQYGGVGLCIRIAPFQL